MTSTTVQSTIQKTNIIEMGLINDQFIENQVDHPRRTGVFAFFRGNADLDAFTKITDIDTAVAFPAKP